MARATTVPEAMFLRVSNFLILVKSFPLYIVFRGNIIIVMNGTVPHPYPNVCPIVSAVMYTK